MECEYAIQRVMTSLDENLFEPGYSWPDRAFEARSYARWAAFEIWERLTDRPRERPDDILCEFMLQMYSLAELTEDPKKKRIFTIAAETAEDIMTLF